MIWRWEYFTPEEVLSPVGLAQYLQDNLLMQPFALDAFDGFRAEFNSPLLVNHGTLKRRGYRSPEENKKVGGASLSRHTQGIAIDVTAKEFEARVLFEAVLQSSARYGFGGIGFYPHRNFVHIDCRPILGKGPKVWEELKNGKIISVTDTSIFH